MKNKKLIFLLITILTTFSSCYVKEKVESLFKTTSKPIPSETEPAGATFEEPEESNETVVIGYPLDEDDRKKLEEIAPETLRKIDHGEGLSTQDIVTLSRAEIHDRIIVSQIENTGTIFQLSSSDILYLKDNGVSQNVIDFMLRTSYPKMRYS
jgi:hypothetical protein